jgi:hypothetical protein
MFIDCCQGHVHLSGVFGLQSLSYASKRRYFLLRKRWETLKEIGIFRRADVDIALASSPGRKYDEVVNEKLEFIHHHSAVHFKILILG